MCVMHVNVCDPMSTYAWTCLCECIHVCVHVCVCFGDQGWEVENGGRGGEWTSKSWREKEEGKRSLLLLSPLLKRNNIPSRRQKGNKTSGSTIYDAN